MQQKRWWCLFGALAIVQVLGTGAIAQIEPDRSLGNERSILTPDGIDRLLIEGGAARGANLFHSFQVFNVGNGQQVYFTNPASIENIIGRVTGGSLSNIDGTLGVLGNANLFLVNPNGIVFGPNARLDIRGSFFASTSNRVVFQDGSVFSATNPEADPILTISTPLGISHWLPTSGTLSSAGNLSTGQDLTLAGQNFDLQGNLSAGGNLGLLASNGTQISGSLQILAGGGVEMPGDAIVAGGTKPTLEIVAGTARIGNITIGNIISPGGSVYLTDLSGDISVGSISTASEAGGGAIVLNSGGGINVGLLDASGGNIFQEQPNITGNGGNVTLLAKNNIFLPFPSAILSVGVVGGNIILQSDTAIVQEDAPFGTDPTTLSSIRSVTFFETGGDIDLTAPSISLGGNVITTLVVAGQGGNLKITADTLRANQATIATETMGDGNSGKVSVNAKNISLDFSVLGSNTSSLSGGNAGDVEIFTNSLNATRGAQIASLITTQGIPGEVPPTLGNAGNVTVIAQDSITLSGFQPTDLPFVRQFLPTSIFSSSVAGTQGSSGKVQITTGTLTLTEGALIGNSSFGLGNAGTIEIQASRSVTIDGAVFADFNGIPEETIDTHPSGIASEVFTGAIGSGGNIKIVTPVLQVTNGGTITASTNGQGDAGNIDITAFESAFFAGLTSFASVGLNDRVSSAGVSAGENSTGRSGTLTIVTPSLSLADGRITAENKGTGTGGNLFIQANSLSLDNQSSIAAETVSNTGGNITIRSDDLLTLRRNSRISTTAGTAGAGGDGGNVTINTRFLVAEPTENSDITANAFTGRGGRVEITAEGIFGLRVLSREELEAKLGTSDPARLNPAFLPTSDITAISQVNPNLSGEVIVQSPDANSDLTMVILPSEVVDASRLIVRDCAARGVIAQQRGGLVVTGRGGLPPEPTGQLRGETLLIGWESLNSSPTTSSVPPAEPPTQLVEVQQLIKRPDGKVVLTAQASGNVISNHSTACPSPNP